MPSALLNAIETHRLVTAPGVFDLLSAKIADAAGFPALYVTGYGVAASHLGLPDAGIATFTDMLSRIERIVRGVATPVIADADTGYGGLLNVRHTTRAYEDAGVAAIQIEDQEFPKKCGHMLGRRVVSRDEAVRRVAVAADARRGDMLIIARTDARTSLGLDEALERARAFADVGADILFVESPESEAELAEIPRSLPKPCLANMVDGGGRSPLMPVPWLIEKGFAVAIYPTLGLLTAAAALQTAYRTLKQDGTTVNSGPMLPFEAMGELMGFGEVYDFERRFLSSS